MRVRSMLMSAVCCVAIGAISVSAGARDTLAKPIPIEVTLRSEGEGNAQRVAGKLVATDEDGITMHVGETERVIAWNELMPISAFGIKFRLIDKTDAGHWLDLGRWAWLNGLTGEARSALGNARRLDKTLAKQIDAILAEPAGQPAPADAAMPTPAGATPAEPAPEMAAPEADPEATPMQPAAEGVTPLVRYTVPTDVENKASIELTRKRTAEAERTLEVTFTEIETAHFLIYTDWDAREHGFLKSQCEGAYNVLARQFKQPPGGNVFVGKLPIYMFATQKAFQRFASEFDEFNAPETVLGYFHSSPTEQGHMAMWKPGVGIGIGAGGSKDDAMRKWGRTLIHEFTHAFIHRYKSNARIPRWLNEGTAEMVSEAALPTNNYRSNARQAAQENVDVTPLFDDANMPSGYYYPVMMTMAECLQKQGAKKFLDLFDEIKAGTEPEAALKKVYGFNYLTLAEGWNKYAKGLK